MRCTTIALFVALACAAAAPSLAQDRPLQDRMGDEVFRAAGLQKLEPAELARLEAWIAQQLQHETTRAVEATERAVAERPAAPRPAPTEVDSTLVGTFDGFGKGREYTLANGQVWRQTDGAQLPGVTRQSPRVQIRPARVGGHWLKVDDFNLRARVERVR